MQQKTLCCFEFDTKEQGCFQFHENHDFNKWQFGGNFNQTATCISGSLVAV
jgi:hypothetical protein